MHKTIFISLVIALLALGLTACGTAATPCEEVSDKPVNIKANYNPTPAVTGDIELIFSVTDANCNPINGATVEVSADHTDMTGMNMSGAATDQGSGTYSIKANFSMSGNWKLTVYVHNNQGLDYKEDIDFKVE